MFDENYWKEMFDNLEDNLEDLRERIKDFKHYSHFRHRTPHIHVGFPAHHFFLWGHWMRGFREELDRYIIKIPLKRYTKEEIKVQVSQRRLAIKFQKEDQTEPRTRYFPLPNDVDPEKTSAKCEEGFLIITLFKKNPDVSVPIE